MNSQLQSKIDEQFRSHADFSMKVPEDESAISRVILGRRTLKKERQQVWAEILECEIEDIFPS